MSAERAKHRRILLGLVLQLGCFPVNVPRDCFCDFPYKSLCSFSLRCA